MPGDNNGLQCVSAAQLFHCLPYQTHNTQWPVYALYIVAIIALQPLQWCIAAALLCSAITASTVVRTIASDVYIASDFWLSQLCNTRTSYCSIVASVIPSQFTYLPCECESDFPVWHQIIMMLTISPNFHSLSHRWLQWTIPKMFRDRQSFKQAVSLTEPQHGSITRIFMWLRDIGLRMTTYRSSNQSINQSIIGLLNSWQTTTVEYSMTKWPWRDLLGSP